jgi:hypothetical protein
MSSKTKTPGTGKRGQEEILDKFLGHGTAAGYD